MRIAPEPDCEPLDCFNNVRRKLEREGGRIQFGYAIWTWPHVLLEAEHHAVYEPPPGGDWRDITPARDPSIKRRLFLPDDTATYDFENEGVRKDNIRLALSNEPLIADFIAAAEERARIYNSIPGIGQVTTGAAILARIRAAEYAQAQAQFQLAMKHTGPNDPCFCESGRKFKRCHGRS